MMPRPATVRYNDWRRIGVPPADAFTPTHPVSVVVPYYEAPAALARTLAALEGQTYPRHLFEVVIVDDGSPTPLEPPRETPLNVTVTRQEDRGFGAARARNVGARQAAHDVLVFLDADMLVEAGWLAAHARWHDVVSDAVTVGFRAFVDAGGIDPAAVRNRPGSLRELLRGLRTDPPWIEAQMSRTDELTSHADDLFRVVASCNLGIRRSFFELVGGFDETFTNWGGEDIELGYRSYAHGGLLVPVREAFAWHQGLWLDGKAEKERRLGLSGQRGKLSNLIPHATFRPVSPGRSFKVPTYVVTIEGAGAPVAQLTAATERVLADDVHDLVVWIPAAAHNLRRERLENEWGPDPRVRISSSASALDDFPVAAFHVTLPAGIGFRRGLLRRLRAALGSAVRAEAVFADGAEVSITRTWALHRARRASAAPADFGDVVTVRGASLRTAFGRFRCSLLNGLAAEGSRPIRPAARLAAELRLVRSPRQAWRFAKWLSRAVAWRAGRTIGSLQRRIRLSYGARGRHGRRATG